MQLIQVIHESNTILNKRLTTLIAVDETYNNFRANEPQDIFESFKATLSKISWFGFERKAL